MAEHDQSETAADKVMKSVAKTPSAGTERPEGVAFDVPEGTQMPGVPVGDQHPVNPDAAHTQEVMRETGEGVGLDVPGQSDQQGNDAAGR